MRYKTKIAGIFSILLVLLINPAYADVTSLKTDKSAYTIEDKIVFSGIVSEPGELVNVVIDRPLEKSFLRSGISKSDGSFSLFAINVDELFLHPGSYEATAFTNTQPIANGAKIFFEYSNDKISVIELFDLNLNPIGNKNVDEEKTLSFTVSVTDPTIENLIFSLEKNPPSGASIDPQTGKFTWTPTEAQGPASYILYIVVNAGSSEDRETIIVSVNEVTQPIPEPKSEPEPKAEPKPKEPVPEKESKMPSFVDTSRDPQYYIDRYSNEESYKAWFDKNYPEITIYEAVGLPEPDVGICGPGTKLVEGVCKIVKEPNGGGCLIATAAFGTELAPQVQKLREIRDNTLLETNSGSVFMTGFNEFYYSFSPTIADWERQNPTFKEAIKLLITPLLMSLSILNHVDIDSEASMLGYGISIIIMNVGMYFIVPITAIIKLKKRFHYI